MNTFHRPPFHSVHDTGRKDDGTPGVTLERVNNLSWSREYRRLAFGVMNGGRYKVFNAVRRTLKHVLELRHHFFDDIVQRSG